jgi:putative oxygen-independent coproporphyrinogen III oxidase
MLTAPPLSLYVHLPWCVRKCPYCDFNSHQLKGSRPDSAYIDALISDFNREWPQLEGRRIETVFFGGGTPSLFAPQDFARLLGAFRSRAPFAADAEITLEANPGTIERGRFAGYRDAGINRVSLGAQSFSAAQLKALGRIHSVDDTLRSVEELRAAGIENFNLDLMYALPQQQPDQALEDLSRAIELKPSHLSHYQLTLEPGTVFHSRPPPLPDDDIAWQMQVSCQDLLESAGYAQYEVSAYAREGAYCQHNLNYWRFGDYLGIGAGAHGKLTFPRQGRILRSDKPNSPKAYQDAIAAAAVTPPGGRQEVSADDLPFEYMMNALRLTDGFTIADFESVTGLSAAVIGLRIERLASEGLLENTTTRWRATPLGRRFLNDLIGRFLADKPPAPASLVSLHRSMS